jgi:hypothetical protein
MYGYVAQTSVATSKADYEQAASGAFTLINPGILERVERLTKELLALCLALGPEIPKEDDGTDL